MQKKPNALRLCTIVASDLLYLRKDWNDTVDDAQLRRGSVVLRRLLVNGDLGKAWRAMNFAGEPSVMAVDLLSELSDLDLCTLPFAMAGGCFYKGMSFAGMVMYPVEGNKERPDRQLTKKPCRLSEFLNAASFVSAGQVVRRRELIKYVANKLGGAHFDESPVDPRFSSAWGCTIFEKPAVFYELLSIGQALAESTDIDNLITAVHRLVVQNKTYR